MLLHYFQQIVCISALVEGFLCLHLSSLHSRKMISSLKHVRNRAILWFDISDAGHGNRIMAENESSPPRYLWSNTVALGPGVQCGKIVSDGILVGLML